MGVQRVLAGVCAVAGVALLAGTGWALLAAAGLLFVAPGGGRLAAAAAHLRAWAADTRSRVVAAPRRAVAAVAMALAIPLVIVGSYLVAGLGVAAIVAAVAFAGASLVAGWNQPPVTAGR